MPNLVHTSALLRNVAADMNGRGAALLDNFQTLLRNASWVGPVLADLGPYPPKIASGIQNTIGALTLGDGLHAGMPVMVGFRRLLDRIQRLLDTSGSDLKVIGERFLPQFKAIAGALMNFDPSQIMAERMPPGGRRRSIRMDFIEFGEFRF